MSETPRTIGRYEVQAELGRGSMGIVHRAHDPVMDRAVAIKTILLPHGLEQDRRADFRVRFLREAQAAGRLSHPGIVTVYEFDQGPDGSLPFIAMEYVEGPDLHELIRTEGALNPDWALTMADTLAGGLQTAHASGVVHRDLKPSNILVRESDGVAKIVDFGVARVNQRNGGATYGSPAYTAPECVRGKVADARSDLYSLAVILYETLSGKRPFEGTTYDALCHAITHDEPASLRLHQPDLSPAFDRFFAKALAKEPSDRFQDAESFRGAVAALRQDQREFASGVSTMIVPKAEARRTAARATTPRRPTNREETIRRWRVILLVALLAMFVSFGAGWGLRGTRPADARMPGQRSVTPPAPVAGGAVTAKPVEPAAARSTLPAEEPGVSIVEPAEPGSGAGGRKPASARTAEPAPAVAQPKPAKTTPPPTPTNEATAGAESSADVNEPTTDSPAEVEAAGPVPAPLPASAHLDLVVKSSVKAGTLTLLLDGEAIFSSDLVAEAGGVSLAFKKTFGRTDQSLEARVPIPPGPHVLRAQVFSEAKDKEFEDTLEIDLGPGEARSLRIFAGRALGRRVSMKLD